MSIWGEKILISGGQSPVYSPGTGHTLSSCQESVWIIQLEGIVRLRIYRLTRIEIDSKLIEKRGEGGQAIL